MLELGEVVQEEEKHLYVPTAVRLNYLSQEEAHFWFSYDWGKGTLIQRWARHLRKDTVGWLSGGKVNFTLMGRHYSVVLTIWALFFGEVPEDFVVDFKDNDSTNTRVENLFLRHKSFIVRRRETGQRFDRTLYRIEKQYTGVSYVETEDGLKGWQAKFKGHSSFGGVSKSGPLRTDMDEARQDYVKMKTEYMRGLFVYPLWDEHEKIYLDSSRYLDEDMIDYFNSLPIYDYQVKYCYKDAFLSKRVLPDIYGLGDCTNTDHPLIQKYFSKYSVFKPRARYVKAGEHKHLRELLRQTQRRVGVEESKRVSFQELLGRLTYHKSKGHTRNWSHEDQELLDKTLSRGL